MPPNRNITRTQVNTILLSYCILGFPIWRPLCSAFKLHLPKGPNAYIVHTRPSSHDTGTTSRPKYIPDAYMGIFQKQKKGPMWTPICYDPCNRDSQKGAPNLWKPPYGSFGTGLIHGPANRSQDRGEASARMCSALGVLWLFL